MTTRYTDKVNIVPIEQLKIRFYTQNTDNMRRSNLCVIFPRCFLCGGSFIQP